MLNIIWIIIFISSFIYSIFSGNIADVGAALFFGAEECISFILKIGAFMIMWSGFISIADESKITLKLSNIFSPIIRRVFPGVSKKSDAERLISSNVTANMLGLSNAATPLGIAAMKELGKKCANGRATNDMCMLAVVNSASLQIIPSTLIAMRSAFGSASPGDITVPIWITSFLTVVFAIVITKICGGKENK